MKLLRITAAAAIAAFAFAPGSAQAHDIVSVKDGSGQQLAYVYYEEEPGRRSAAKLLTKDEARRIAVKIAKLP